MNVSIDHRHLGSISMTNRVRRLAATDSELSEIDQSLLAAILAGRFSRVRKILRRDGATLVSQFQTNLDSDSNMSETYRLTIAPFRWIVAICHWDQPELLTEVLQMFPIPTEYRFWGWMMAVACGEGHLPMVQLLVSYHKRLPKKGTLRIDLISSLGSAAIATHWEIVAYLAQHWRIDWATGRHLRDTDRATLSSDFFYGALRDDHPEMMRIALVHLQYDMAECDDWDRYPYPIRSIAVMMDYLVDNPAQKYAIIHKLLFAITAPHVSTADRRKAVRVSQKYVSMSRILHQALQELDTPGMINTVGVTDYHPAYTIRMLIKYGVRIPKHPGHHLANLLQAEIISPRWATKRCRAYEPFLDRQGRQRIKAAAKSRYPDVYQMLAGKK